MSLVYTTGFDHDAYSNRMIPFSVTVTSPGRFGRGRYIRLGNGNSYFNLNLADTERHNSMYVGLAARDTLTPYTDMSNTSSLIKLFGDTSQMHVAIYFTLDSPGHYKIRAARGAHANMLGESDVLDLQEGVWHYWEFRVTIDDADGEVIVRRDGVTILNVNGIDTRNGGANSNAYMVQFGQNANNSMGSIDDVYVIKNDGIGITDFLGEIEVEALLPNGNGTHSQLVGSDGDSTNNYLLVDDSPTVNDNDYVGSAVDGAKDTYTFGNLARPSSIVRAVQVSFRTKKSDTGPKSMRRVIRSNGTDDTGSDITLSSSFSWNQEIFEKNPVTDVDWTQSDVDNIEAGTEVRP